jgi:hypothetical protein
VVAEHPTQDYVQNVSITRRQESKRRHALELRDNLLLAVQDLEGRLDIDDRWVAGSEEWSAAAVMVSNRRYQRALDKLHVLVIARLFELTKCNMSGTGASFALPHFVILTPAGYKMRKHIAKALQARSKAIKTAIEAYNTAAASLDVPREPLSWQEVVDYTFLSDFDLLHLARVNIRAEGWAQPAGREAMDRYFKLVRADEEIVRLNIEIPRLVTYMRDEEAFLRRAVERVQEGVGPELAHQVSVYRMRQGRFNDGHRYRFTQLARDPGFSGDISPGVPVNKEQLLDDAPPSSVAPEIPSDFDSAALGDEDKDDDEDEASTLEAAFTVMCVTEDPPQ